MFVRSRALFCVAASPRGTVTSVKFGTLWLLLVTYGFTPRGHYKHLIVITLYTLNLKVTRNLGSQFQPKKTGMNKLRNSSKVSNFHCFLLNANRVKGYRYEYQIKSRYLLFTSCSFEACGETIASDLTPSAFVKGTSR